MNSNLSVNVTQCRNLFDDYNRVSDRLQQAGQGIQTANNCLQRMDFNEKVQLKLLRLIEQVEEQEGGVRTLRRTLDQIVDLYVHTETSITDNIKIDNSKRKAFIPAPFVWIYNIWEEIVNFFDWRNNSSGTVLDSVVFDAEGAYGGAQGGPQSEWGWFSEKKELYGIVRQYHSDLSDKEISAYLNKLNDEGCGYVSVINTIFAAYEGREAEFAKTFGFPMYEDGDLNYNKLLVDFYSATDNHNLDGTADFIDVNEDRDEDEAKKDDYNYKMDSTGYGTSQYDREYRTKLYLDEKGVDVSISTDSNVTIDNFKYFAQNDEYVVIAYRYGNLQNEDGSIADYINGGHAMTVTGVTDDGRYIVSSWGEKYYIDPNELVTKDDNTTSFTFSTFKYN